MNIEAIERATTLLLQQGVRVLNPFLLADTEWDHAARLLELMDPPQGAAILDAGCGVGQLAKLMRAQRPDLEFTLLNVSQAQLDECPEAMPKICAPYEATGLPDACVDVVMFAFSLCHAADWGAALREAFRVLKPTGVVFVFDMARTDPGNGLMREILASDAYRPSDVLALAYRCGLQLDTALAHQPKVERLRAIFETDAASQADYDVMFRGVIPVTYRFHRMAYAAPVASAFARHERIAFQFSGGRDSTAALFLLEPYWDKLDVYTLLTGDNFPEQQAVVDAVEKMLPKRIHRIYSDVRTIRETHGFPSDVVPVDNSPIGRLVSGRTVKIMPRYECCARALMNPLHERMQADGITLVIRGQRDDEYDKPPHRSGDVSAGIEVLYPVQQWNAAQVDSYLKERGLPVAPFYAAGMKRAPECMGCTAWWDEGRPAYLKQYHPEAYATYLVNAGRVRNEIDRQLAQLET